MARLPLTAEGRSASLAELSMLALGIGIITGLAGVLFRAIVAGIHNFFFLGEFSLYYDPNIHTPSSWLGPLVILSPVLGGLLVIWLSRLPPADRRGCLASSPATPRAGAVRRCCARAGPRRGESGT